MGLKLAGVGLSSYGVPSQKLAAVGWPSSVGRVLLCPSQCQTTATKGRCLDQNQAAVNGTASVNPSSQQGVCLHQALGEALPECYELILCLAWLTTHRGLGKSFPFFQIQFPHQQDCMG